MGKDTPPSEPPPSSLDAPPIKGGATGYVVGFIVLAGLAGLLMYSRCSEEPAKPDKPTAAVKTVAPQPQPPPMPEFAPPPPPEKDAGADAAPSAAPVAASGAPATSAKSKAPSGGGACARCGEGVASAALKSAVAQTANLARGCYNRALQQGGAEGVLTVSVSVGSTGALCGASASGSVGNPVLKQCVLTKFKSRSYPKPKEGCVVINVPISFKMKL